MDRATAQKRINAATNSASYQSVLAAQAGSGNERRGVRPHRANCLACSPVSPAQTDCPHQLKVLPFCRELELFSKSDEFDRRWNAALSGVDPSLPDIPDEKLQTNHEAADGRTRKS